MADVQTIRQIVFDVDGVLTDGSIIINDQGIEAKRFFVRDGFAIKAAMSCGITIGIITGRSTRAVNLRMTELGIKHVQQGVKDKAQGIEALCQKTGITLAQTAYVGDDLIDLPAMSKVGYAIAVADAAAEVRDFAHWTTSNPGGRGAARDAIEHVLKAQDLWEKVVAKYMPGA